jgi:GDP-4-dehydro-6-deoxy-D-mannose reductase
LKRRVTLVTGVAGFVGSWLVPKLEARGDRIVGVDKPGTPAGGPERIDCDLRDPEAVAALVGEVRPARIVHLAAIAYPPNVQADPLEGLRLNYGAVDHLLRAVARHVPEARVLCVSTSQVYGTRAAGEAAFRETDPLMPRDAYAATKAAAEQRAGLACEREGLDVMRARPFNHSGPRRPEAYVESSFARQLARIEHGKQDPVLRVGNLDAVRDFSDVRDVVAAYALLLDEGERGAVYNVCSGRGWTIRALLEHLLARVSVRPRVEVDPERFRPTPPRGSMHVGDPGRLRGLGWAPRHRFEETLDALLDYWRSRV